MTPRLHPNQAEIDLAQGQVASVKTFDEDEARELIALAESDGTFRQRRLKPKRVERYAHTMLNGQWLLNGETATFDKKRVPLDCQHRLNALILANEMAREQGLGPVTWTTWVIENVDRRAFLSMGDNAPRKLADALFISGKNVVDGEEVSEKQLATALKWLDAYEKGTILHNEGITPIDGFLTLKENEGLGEHLVWALAKPRFQGVQPSILSVCRYLCFQADPKKAAEFFKNFKHEDGYTFRKDDPGAILAQQMAAEAQLKRSTRFDYIRFARVIKAWNYYMAGVNAKAVTFKRKGSRRAEQFPTVFNRNQAVQHARTNRLYDRMGGTNPRDIPSGTSPIASLGVSKKIEAALTGSEFHLIGDLLDHRMYRELPPSVQSETVERLEALGFLRNGQNPGGEDNEDAE